MVRFARGELAIYPPFPDHYFNAQSCAILQEFKETLLVNKRNIDEFPEAFIISHLDNTWHDSAEAVINNWIGKVYQITNNSRHLPFMSGIDKENPLNL